jgi:hypothetical protein
VRVAEEVPGLGEGDRADAVQGGRACSFPVPLVAREMHVESGLGPWLAVLGTGRVGAPVRFRGSALHQGDGLVRVRQVAQGLGAAYVHRVGVTEVGQPAGHLVQRGVEAQRVSGVNGERPGH